MSTESTAHKSAKAKSAVKPASRQKPQAATKPLPFPHHDLYRLVVEQARDLISIRDENGMMLYVSPSFESVLGYKPEDIVGTNAMKDLVHPDDVGHAADTINTARSGHASSERAVRVRHAMGYWVYTEGIASVIRHEEGGPDLVLTVSRDVTDRELAKHEVWELHSRLEQQLSELEALLDVAPAGIGITRDPEAKDIRVNKTFAKILGMPPGSNVSKSNPKSAPPYRVLHDGIEVEVDNLPLQLAVRTGKAVPGTELDIIRNDGSVVTIYGSAQPLIGEGGKTRGAVCAFLDITEKRIEELRIKEANKRITGILEDILSKETEAHDAF